MRNAKNRTAHVITTSSLADYINRAGYHNAQMVTTASAILRRETRKRSRMALRDEEWFPVWQIVTFLANAGRFRMVP